MSKYYMTATLIAFMGAQPALADPKGPFDTGDSWGPHMPIARTQDQWNYAAKYSGTYLARSTVPIPAQGSDYDRAPWVNDASPKGYADAASADHNDDLRRSWNDFVANGGCSADFVPFDHASSCMSGVFLSGPHGQMGSEGN